MLYYINCSKITLIFFLKILKCCSKGQTCPSFLYANIWHETLIFNAVTRTFHEQTHFQTGAPGCNERKASFCKTAMWFQSHLGQNLSCVKDYCISSIQFVIISTDTEALQTVMNSDESLRISITSFHTE